MVHCECDDASIGLHDPSGCELERWTRLARLEAQGARCGHIDGKARCGVYSLGEESFFSDEAASVQGLSGAELRAWANGYEAGYRVGADGEALDEDTKFAPLP